MQMNNVVVFIPPPVDTGDAPTIIRNNIIIIVGTFSREKSIVLNPAVLNAIDWNIELVTLSFIDKLPKVSIL